MLVEPERDAERARLDHALVEAVRARLAAGRGGAPDAEALALREALAGATPAEAGAVKALLGRMGRRTVLTAGGLSTALAADRFGFAAVRPTGDPEAALSALAPGGCALIDLAAAKPWWGRLLARNDLFVIGALPDDRAGRPRALMVATDAPGPTGDDRTFWITDSAWPDGQIVEALSAAGLAAEPLAASGGLKLFMLTGYVQAEDGRLTNAPGALSGVIGAAPLF